MKKALIVNIAQKLSLVFWRMLILGLESNMRSTKGIKTAVKDILGEKFLSNLVEKHL